MTAVEVRLLGPVELSVDGDEVVVTAAKVRSLLAMLAVDASTAVSSDELADRLWRGEPPATAPSVLRTYVSQLRRLLAGAGGRLERAGEGYLLRLAPDELDVTRFIALSEAAMKPTCAPAEAARLFREALSLWRGAALRELADDARAQALAAGLEEQRWVAVEALADVELELGLHQGVVADLEAAVVDAPLREGLVGRLMLALYRSGRQADALAAFQRLRHALVEDLGLEPSAELRKLESGVLDQDPALDAPVRPVGNLPAPITSFVGRERELAEVQAACEAHGW